MRETEFRGKRIDNNEWIYGSLVIIENIDGEKTFSIFKRDGACQYVKQETIGEYTGLKDKNGEKIFEGDIVKLVETNYNYEWTAVVEFGNPNSGYVWGWNLKPITKDVKCNLDILCWVEIPIGATCEVIGNIYCNPELLEVEK